MAFYDAHHASATVADQPADAHWYALWTASHCERLVRDQLVARGFTAFLPEMQVWSQRRGVRRLVAAPMFAGYLFLRHAMTKESYVDIRKARGLVRILGERWDRPAEVPDRQIDAIHRLHDAQLPAMPHPFLQAGHRVRIITGPLAGVEGTMLKADAGKGLLVLSVNLLQRSVAVQVDCTSVTPVWSGTRPVHQEAGR